MNELDTSFTVPSFGLQEKEKFEVNPYDVIKEYDRKVEDLTKELITVRFERDRYRTAIDLLSVYIKDLI